MKTNKNLATTTSLRSAEPTNQVMAAEAVGTNVNDKVNVHNFTFDSKDLYPNNSGYSNMNATFKVEGTVREGDYFTFVLPHNLTADGDIDYSNLNNTMVLPKITNVNGDVLATGTYNTETKVGTYTFTSYVNDKENISGYYSLPIFTDRKNTPESGNYDLTFDMAGETYYFNININYGNPVQGQPGSYGANVTSFITEIDTKSGANEYQQTIYVNPKGNYIYNTNVTLQGYHDDPTQSSTLLNRDATQFKIYEVVDASKLTDSYYIDPNSSNYIDVTNDVLPYVRDNGNNTITFNFENINKTYVIVVDGHYDDSGKNVKTRVIETNTDYYGNYRSSYYWDNENIIKNGSAGGDGESDSDADADSDSDSDKELPDTGEDKNNNATLFGSLFAAFGSLLLFRRRKINKENE
ncbi:fibrinogen-binding adhesin SdrG C-terminal domain-containing protein [Staphylococcus gallinarum]|uniref:fibrinogen-binding adhesin SdrG C-terminal domain-containing protein n=1 Tax=Staphylococcus gallinarum TaxID=1293 RepID=UPI000D1ED5FE|nr:fibrinogen-binding adhesin SdrG C-terminal domain-containing protein [Staphylococcus gallinarum]PTK89449.1 hypothetical protein BUZ05_11820 [Staphylococcus gallinarum]RIO91200.1 LPXTG cell wall anchor domain-containing protein [Staphylococcus gallinarum]